MEAKRNVSTCSAFSEFTPRLCFCLAQCVYSAGEIHAMTLKTFEIYSFHNSFMKNLVYIDDESLNASATNISDGIRGALLQGIGISL